MREHVERGEELLRDVPELRIIAHTVRHHHERFDGRGYPEGLAGTTIPIEARILAAVDTWSALRRDRPYRAALDEADAVAELRGVAGAQLDPDVVEALCAVLGAGFAPQANTRKGTWPSGPAFP
jgi:HD-GYP domain-containing protein (c-di-GMP phosphodiesterase class II)